MPDTGVQQQEGWWESIVTGRAASCEVHDKQLSKRLGAIPCGTGWAKGHIFFLHSKTCGRLLGLFLSAFAFTIAAHSGLEWHHTVPPSLALGW